MTASTHTGRVHVGGVALEPTQLTLNLDEEGVPYAVGTIVAKAPDAATLAALDPRDNPRVQLSMTQRFGDAQPLSAISADYAGQTLYDMAVASGALNPNPGFEEAEPDVNLIGNADFETDASGWSAVGGTFERSTAQAHTGAASGLLTPDGVTELVEALGTVPGGVTAPVLYSFRVWVYSPSGYPSVRFAIEYLDESGATIELTTEGAVHDIPAGVWTEITYGRQAPIGSVDAVPHVQMIGTPSASDVLYVDTADFDYGFVYGWYARFVDDILVQSTDHVHSGTYSARLERGSPASASDSPDIGTEFFDVNKGVPFIVGLYVYSTGPDTEMWGQMNYYDDDWNPIDGDITYFTPLTPTPGEWTHVVAASDAIPDNPMITRAGLELYPYTPDAETVLYWDDITVRYARPSLRSLTNDYGHAYNAGGMRPSTTVRAALWLRSRNVDHSAGTVTLEAASGDALLSDYALVAEEPMSPVGSTVRDCMNMVLGHVLGVALEPGTTGSQDVEPEALDWQPGENAWAYLSGIVGSAGLRPWCDELGRFHLEDPFTHTVPGTVALSGAENLTNLTDRIDRQTGQWAEAVIVRYVWADSFGNRLTRVDMAGPADASRVTVVEIERPYPGPGLAAARLKRAQARGRSLTVGAVANYDGRPFNAAMLSYPDGSTQTGLVSAISWTQPNDVMTVRTRDIRAVGHGSWLYTPSGVAWDDIAVGVSWDDYEGGDTYGEWG